MLGQLLFFINDIGHSTETVTKLFADDTSKSKSDIRAEIPTSDLCDWAKLWKAKLNENKTELCNIM